MKFILPETYKIYNFIFIRKKHISALKKNIKKVKRLFHKNVVVKKRVIYINIYIQYLKTNVW